jgi:hypothetical protein
MMTFDRLFLPNLILAGLCGLLAGCAHAKVTSEAEVAPAPVGPPVTVYVSDFELAVADIKSESLIPWHGPIRRFLVGSWNRTPQEFHDRAVNAMAAAIVKELRKAGYQAERWQSGQALPDKDWLVRGVVVTVDQGNLVRRAVVGFGLGEAQLKVAVAVSDLTLGAPKPFYKLDTEADSGKMPGAGPMVVLSPWAIPVHFVLDSRDMDECINKTAVLIANQISLRIKEQNSQATSK